MNRRAFLVGAGGATVLIGSGAVVWKSSVGSMVEYDDYAKRLRAPIAKQADGRELIRYATLAANGHNTQPSRFLVRGDAIDLPTVLGRPALDLFFTAQSERDRYARHLNSSPGLAVFIGERADKAHWMQVGRACQRFAQTAASPGLKHAFVNQPVEVASLRGNLATLVGEPGKRPDLVLRFGFGPTLPFTPRRSVDAVLA